MSKLFRLTIFTSVQHRITAVDPLLLSLISPDVLNTWILWNNGIIQNKSDALRLNWKLSSAQLIESTRIAQAISHNNIQKAIFEISYNIKYVYCKAHQILL